MSANQKIRIHAMLRTLSPLHITSPEAARLNIAEMKPIYGDSKEHPPLNLTQKMTVHEAGNSPRNVPVIAANNVMGRLRRHAAACVLDALRSNNERIKISTYMGLQCGAVTGNPDGRDPLFQDFKDAHAHPYLGLLGGGPRMIRRAVHCFNMVPYMDATAIMFSRAMHPHLDDSIHKAPADPRRLTQCWIMNRNDDLRELVNISQASEVVEDFDAQMTARQTAIIASSSADNRSEGDARLSTRSFSALEFVVPGVYFPMVFELDVNDAQMGLFLASLDRFAQKERLGGHSRNGFGNFSLTDVVATDMDGQILADGLFANSRLKLDNDFVKPYLKAWVAAAKEIDARELDRLFAPPLEESKAKRQAKASAAKSTTETV